MKQQSQFLSRFKRNAEHEAKPAVDAGPKDPPRPAPPPEPNKDPFAGLSLKMPMKSSAKKEKEPSEQAGAGSHRSTHSTEPAAPVEQTAAISFVKADLPAVNEGEAKNEAAPGAGSVKGAEGNREDFGKESPLKSEKGFVPDDNRLAEQKHSKSVGRQKSKEDSVISQMTALHQQHKEKDARQQFVSILREDAAKARTVMDEELSQYARKCVDLQLEQQSLMVRKREIQHDLDIQRKEIENTTEQLAVLTKEEKYKEAEAVNLRLKNLTDVVP